MSNDLDFDEVCCDSPSLPAGVSVGHSMLTGAFVASCSACSFVSVYWACACELVHDCNGGES